MEIVVEAALLNAMKTSTALTAIVPAANISNDWPNKAVTLPAISLFEVSEKSDAMLGYNNGNKKRVNLVVWQCSVRAATKAQARQIVSILDRIFTPGLPTVDLSCVKRTNDADAYEQEPGDWHLPPRYQGVYTVTDP